MDLLASKPAEDLSTIKVLSSALSSLTENSNQVNENSVVIKKKQ